jgi:TolB-like protein
VTDIRRASGDNDHTLFKTVPKRGYVLVQEPSSAEKTRIGTRWKTGGLALLTVLLASLGIYGFAGRSPSTPVERREVLPSVAVLPFESFGGDSTKRLADGLTHDLTTDLASFPEFHVLARKTTAGLGSMSGDPRELGGVLHADYLIEGSIQHDADVVRIAARLVDASNGAHRRECA